MPPMCWFSLAELYLLMGNMSKAADILENTSSENMNFGWVYSINGLYQYLMGDRAGALELFELALQQYKKTDPQAQNIFFPILLACFMCWR